MSTRRIRLDLTRSLASLVMLSNLFSSVLRTPKPAKSPWPGMPAAAPARLAIRFIMGKPDPHNPLRDLVSGRSSRSPECRYSRGNSKHSNSQCFFDRKVDINGLHAMPVPRLCSPSHSSSSISWSYGL